MRRDIKGAPLFFLSVPLEPLQKAAGLAAEKRSKPLVEKTKNYEVRW